jgi:hypothetical protein
MGQETVVKAAKSLSETLAVLAAEGQSLQIVMVDGQLVIPAAPIPEVWTEVRLRSLAGVVTLRRRAGEVSVLVFGNAEPALIGMRDRVAAALGGARGS